MSEPLAVRRDGGWLVVPFHAPHDILSWAVVNGGRRRAPGVAWRQVRDDELHDGLDAEAYLRGLMDGAALSGMVGLMTSHPLNGAQEVVQRAGAEWARVVATVGLKNALAAGDPPSPETGAGTINVLCQLSVALTEEALVEALALCAEARTAAVRAASVPSIVSGAPATGTGTDCIVVAAPSGPAAERYAGKHTRTGHLAGAAVAAAVDRGVKAWMERARRA